VEVVLAGPPGPDLLEILRPDRPCILMDVTWSRAPPGTIHKIPLLDLMPGILPDLRVSSHGFGPGEALSLARALGRSIPPGVFLGIEGESFEVGRFLSPPVEAGVERLVREVRMLVEAWAG
jgi:hydrogenase maturation protease